MPGDKGTDKSSNGRISLSPRLVGQFILWAIITTVGGGIYMILNHDKAIALIEQRLTTIEERINEVKDLIK